MMPENTDNQKEWLYRLIDEFRKVVKDPPEIKCRDQLLDYDFRAPTQKTILWLKNNINDLQLSIINHNSEFQDKTVEIFGPYYIDKDDFKNINQIIRDLFKYVEKVNDIESLKIELNRIIRENIGILNKSPENRIFIHELFNHQCLYFLFNGNIFQMSIDDILESMIRHNKINNYTRDIPWTYNIKIFLTGYIYPLIWFGDVPELTLKDKLVGKNLSYFTKIIYEKELSSRALVIMNDGLMGLETKTKFGEPFEGKKMFDTIKILNLLLSIFLLKDIPVQTIHASEFSIGSFDSDLKSFSFYSQESIITKHFYNLRYNSIDIDNFSKERKIVNLVDLGNIVNYASKLIKNEKITNSLTILIHAYTNLTKGEFNQSFILNWKIIEQYLNNLWKSVLLEQSISNNRIKKLEGREYTADVRLEVLNIFGYISYEEYTVLDNLRRKRNKFIHEQLSISPELAQKALILAKKYIKMRVKDYLKNKSI